MMLRVRTLSEDFILLTRKFFYDMLIASVQQRSCTISFVEAILLFISSYGITGKIPVNLKEK